MVLFSFDPPRKFGFLYSVWKLHQKWCLTAENSPLLVWLLHCDKKMFFKVVFLFKMGTPLIQNAEQFSQLVFFAPLMKVLYIFPWMCLFFSFFPLVLLIASGYVWKQWEGKTRDARLAQKHKKPSLTKMWDKGGSTFNPKEKVLAVHVTFHFCEVSSQKSLFILNKDVNDLEGEQLAELFTSKNCCSKFFKGHLGQKERRGEKKEEIWTNLSILILVHFSKGARRDEFFWGLGIKLWPLSVSFRALFLTLPKFSLIPHDNHCFLERIGWNNGQFFLAWESWRHVRSIEENLK